MKFSDEDIEICPICGRKYNDIVADSRLLPEGSILSSNIIVGSCIKIDGYENEYVGYDIKAGQKVAIYEFFPQNLGIERNTAESFSVSPISEADDICYQEYIDAYVNRAECLCDICETNSTLQKLRCYFYENNTAYLICDYIEGVGLDEVLKEKKINCAQMLSIGNMLIDLVKAGNRKGCYFCDVTSENVVIQNDGQIKMLISGAGGDGKYTYIKETQANDMIKNYHPAEVLSYTDTIAEKTDVYVVSVLLYEMLSGVPFNNNVSESILKKVKKRNVPKSILKAIDDGLGLNSSKRSENFDEFIDIHKFNCQMLKSNKESAEDKNINKKVCYSLAVAFIVVMALIVSLGRKTGKDTVYKKSANERKKIVAEMVTNEPTKEPEQNTIQPTAQPSSQSSISINIEVVGPAFISPSPSPKNKSAVKSADSKKKHIKKTVKAKKESKKEVKKVRKKVVKRIVPTQTPKPPQQSRQHISRKVEDNRKKKKTTIKKKSSEKLEKYTEEYISGLK